MNKLFLLFLPIVLTVSQPAQPNIVLILVDDMRYDDLAYMPHTQGLIGERGAIFTNYFVTQSVCCPARVSILRGQYPHNHGITHNDLPDGGFKKVQADGIESSTLATWLDEAGYTTAIFGKYLNDYRSGDAAYIAPGWDRWYAKTQGYYINWKVSDQGVLSGLIADYETDVLSQRTVSFIQQGANTPFFIFLNPPAPHGPAIPASRHAGLFTNLPGLRPPSFNEADMSDKPSFMTEPLLGDGDIDYIDNLYRKRLETLQAVDEMVESIVLTLENSGQLENTYIIFTSDNGFHLGEHRQKEGKNTVYEEDMRVPLLIRGPGIAPGQIVPELVTNNDLPATIAQWAGVSVPAWVDGRSFAPLLRDTPWRHGFLQERWPPSQVQAGTPRLYHALRNECYTYVEYANGEGELYDLRTDPYQLNNIYLSTDPALIAIFSARLAALKTCAGETCRVEEETISRCELN